MYLKISVSFITGLSLLMASFFKSIERPSDHRMDETRWSIMVKEDYRKLRCFTNNQNLFGFGEERFEELLLNGLTEALDFHQSATNLNAAMVNQWLHTQFMTNPHLAHKLPVPQIVSADKSRAFEAYTNFQGFWHGRWKSAQVQHHWLPVREHYKRINEKVHLLGFQSCFTGDGIGWNYVVEKEGDIVLLGFVYHMDFDGSIAFGNPHYAFLNSGGQLTWVSDDHIYYEFTCANPRCENGRHYVITGGHYKNDCKKPHLVSGFQAVYLSINQELPKFEALALTSREEKENRFWETWATSAKESFQTMIPNTEYVRDSLWKTLTKLSKVISINKILQKLK